MGRWSGSIAVVLALGCGNDSEHNPFLDGSASASASATTTTTSSTGTTAGQEAGSMTGGQDSASDESGFKFDTPSGSDIGLPTGEGCEKIDFLFVVDNSGSMAVHQANLVANFGPFIDTIEANVAGHDYHIMVVDTDSCPTMGNCTPMGCEDTLGAGAVHGCPMPPERYLTSQMPISDIKSSFECAAEVGDFGSASEMPMDAMIAATTIESAAGGCNPGFLRDDAVLVVTIISDDHPGWFGPDNATSIGTPGEWFDAIVAAKNGHVDHLVVLGLLATPGDESCLGFCPCNADKFIDFVDMFGARGIVASVCQPDYDQFFQQAVELIDMACDEFEPAG
ncbi:hypothetical protein [Paraliomyxa miuraensis]|uniref:hypothetical protein n=1 Tax=Paraliomyxa miuraensis TaxID=376150 RepID=UPI00225A6040|nr:hypothetical protein [Paraliomyxa miuraensis]MCX4240095.1 hypothetical protein [Paraliomyxa miuraensis]